MNSKAESMGGTKEGGDNIEKRSVHHKKETKITT